VAACIQVSQSPESSGFKASQMPAARGADRLLLLTAWLIRLKESLLTGIRQETVTRSSLSISIADRKALGTWLPRAWMHGMVRYGCRILDTSSRRAPIRNSPCIVHTQAPIRLPAFRQCFHLVWRQVGSTPDRQRRLWPTRRLTHFAFFPDHLDFMVSIVNSPSGAIR
jgi:hypothetical protein